MYLIRQNMLKSEKLKEVNELQHLSGNLNVFSMRKIVLLIRNTQDVINELWWKRCQFTRHYSMYVAIGMMNHGR